jgi:hypothetical protein
VGEGRGTRVSGESSMGLSGGVYSLLVVVSVRVCWRIAGVDWLGEIVGRRSERRKESVGRCSVHFRCCWS